MALLDVIRDRFERAIGLHDELARGVPEAALAEKLPGLPSNTLGQQLWCVVGARESYARALAAGRWEGFTCSLSAEDCERKQAVCDALSASGTAVLEVLAAAESFDDARHRLMVDLLEHEAAHHGQIVRYLYGLRLPIPGGWKSRYALE